MRKLVYAVQVPFFCCEFHIPKLQLNCAACLGMRFADCGAGRTREQSMRCDGPVTVPIWSGKCLANVQLWLEDERLRFDGGSLGCKRH